MKLIFCNDQNKLSTLHFWNCHSMAQNKLCNAIYHTIYSVTEKIFIILQQIYYKLHMRLFKVK